MTQRQIALNLAGMLAVIGLLGGWYWQSTGARAVPALAARLGDERPEVRFAAAMALGEIGPEARAAAPALLDLALREGDDGSGAMAAGALGTIDLTAARQAMAAHMTRLESGDANARRRACEVLASLGPVAKPAVSALVQATKDGDDVVRNRAVSALGRIALPTAQVTPALVAALDDPATAVRYTAALQFSFGQVPAEAIPALTRRAADPEKSVAGLAERAVAGASQNPLANVPVLVMMLRTSSARDYTLLQVAKLGPRAAEATPALIPILSAPRPLERYLAAEALAAIGPAASAARPALEAALRDEEPVVRESAAAALEAIAHAQTASRATEPR
jgi:HEAT repeat protein